MTTHTIVLPYARPPLTANQRLHWAEKSRRTREIRSTAYWCAKRARTPSPGKCAVTAVWFPPDRRVRDAGSLSLTVKAALDGFTDAGLWPDDNTDWVTSETYKIGDIDRTHPRIEIQLEATAR